MEDLFDRLVKITFKGVRDTNQEVWAMVSLQVEVFVSQM